ncbi:MAG: Holliday junction branch migration protein RuvA [Chlamydiae bacterium CG10_big_fil_rev_8_21_14_0_10_42_34]|nr:MAG: Holliday junction branch migration protein RuvA [Chlamydiae bacterium CG10_big_fil_rev_8_21_14_0_10_42_34]
MYESIKGLLIDKTPIKAIVETGGIGYRLSIPLSAYAHLPALNAPVQFFLSQVVREDSNTLYAFLSKDERDLFETLITISGVGPKTALGIIGHMDLSAFQRAIASADVRLLSKIPGIGKKSAERLVIEMRDKIKGTSREKGALLTPADGLTSDAMNALIHLGYNPLAAQKAVQAVLLEKKEESDLGKIITAALQKI